MSEGTAIRARNLGKHYRAKWAVRNLALHVPEGSVYGFLGLNGAGKTTTIQMLMGLICPDAGEAGVLGLNPARDPVGVKSQVGYVAETHNFYEWMTVEEICGFVARYRPDWDKDFANELLSKFFLNPHARISELSKGQRATTSLVLAIAFRPKLLILDEPTSGLDPSARREFFEGVLAGYQNEGGTVLVSSHLVNEISGLVDHVGIIHRGSMRFELPVDDLRASIKRIRVLFESGVPGSPIVCPGLMRTETSAREAVLTVRDFAQHEEQVRKVLATYAPTRVEVEHLNLEDVFVELEGKG